MDIRPEGQETRPLSRTPLLLFPAAGAAMLTGMFLVLPMTLDGADWQEFCSLDTAGPGIPIPALDDGVYCIPRPVPVAFASAIFAIPLLPFCFAGFWALHQISTA